MLLRLVTNMWSAVTSRRRRVAGRKRFAVQRSVHRIFGRTRVTVLSAALLSGAALPAAGLWAAGPASAVPNPSCVFISGTTTCTFAYTGASTDFTVPPGITTLTVVADGGSGADASSTWTQGGGDGGNGGGDQATLTRVPAHTTLSVFPRRAGNRPTARPDARS